MRIAISIAIVVELRCPDGEVFANPHSCYSDLPLRKMRGVD